MEFKCINQSKKYKKRSLTKACYDVIINLVMSMNNNLTVTEIMNVYYIETNDWARDFFAPREFDGAVFFTEGEIEYSFHGKTLVARKGDVLFLPGNLPYSGKKISDKVSFFVIDFKCLGEFAFESFGAPCTVPCVAITSVLSEFEKALEAWEKQTPESIMVIKSKLYSLFGLFYSKQINIHSAYPVEEILKYVAENISQQTLSVKNICEHFFISESQLRRNFRKITGVSPNEYITTIRINRAKSELSYTSKSISTIAIECGFSNQYYFSRCFQKVTGMSPSKYRTIAYV